MYLSIKDDSIFVADSHYNQKNKQFLVFLEKLNSQEIKTSQLFLMGDMIDFISGESKYFIKQNSDVIELLNKLICTFLNSPFSVKESLMFQRIYLVRLYLCWIYVYAVE